MSICKFLAITTLILGIIGSFIIANSFGVTSTLSYSGKLLTVRSWGATVGYFVSGVFATAIQFAILYGIGTILEKLDDMKYENAVLRRSIQEPTSNDSANTNNTLDPSK